MGDCTARSRSKSLAVLAAARHKDAAGRTCGIVSPTNMMVENTAFSIERSSETRPVSLWKGPRDSAAVMSRPRSERSESLRVAHERRLDALYPFAVVEMPDVVPDWHGRPCPADSAWRTSLFNDILRGVRLQASLLYWPEFRAPWGISLKADRAALYLVDSGACWLEAEGVTDPLALSEGDFVLVKGGLYHTLRDQLSTPTLDFFDLVRINGDDGGAICWGGEGPITRIVCGGMFMQTHKFDPLLTIRPTPSQPVK